jgi:hypothetical protein
VSNLINRRLRYDVDHTKLRLGLAVIAEDAIVLAEANEQMVEFVFDGTTVRVMADSDLGYIRQAWNETEQGTVIGPYPDS